MTDYLDVGGPAPLSCIPSPRAVPGNVRGKGQLVRPSLNILVSHGDTLSTYRNFRNITLKIQTCIISFRVALHNAFSSSRWVSVTVVPIVRVNQLVCSPFAGMISTSSTPIPVLGHLPPRALRNIAKKSLRNHEPVSFHRSSKDLKPLRSSYYNSERNNFFVHRNRTEISLSIIRLILFRLISRLRSRIF